MEKNLRRQNFKERRKAPRFDVFLAMPTLKSIRRVGGHEVSLINISRLGALIESREWMSSGSRVVLRAVTAETVYIFKGRITRCSISPRKYKTYQAGIEFDEEFTFLPVSIELLNLFKDDENFLK
jgi:hypothetical protein